MMSLTVTSPPVPVGVLTNANEHQRVGMAVDAVMVRTGREGDRLARLSHRMAVGHAAQDCRATAPISMLGSYRSTAS